jgi:hypothetical protein
MYQQRVSEWLSFKVSTSTNVLTESE